MGIPKLAIPNKVIEKLYYDYLGDYIARQTEQRPAELRVQDAVVEMAEHNDPNALLQLVSDTLQQLSHRDWMPFNEHTVKAILISYRHALDLRPARLSGGVRRRDSRRSLASDRRMHMVAIPSFFIQAILCQQHLPVGAFDHLEQLVVDALFQRGVQLLGETQGV